jgi:hypothetical protein
MRSSLILALERVTTSFMAGVNCGVAFAEPEFWAKTFAPIQVNPPRIATATAFRKICALIIHLIMNALAGVWLPLRTGKRNFLLRPKMADKKKVNGVIKPPDDGVLALACSIPMKQSSVIGVPAASAIAWAAGRLSDSDLLLAGDFTPEAVFIANLPSLRAYHDCLAKCASLRAQEYPL